MYPLPKEEFQELQTLEVLVHFILFHPMIWRAAENSAMMNCLHLNAQVMCEEEHGNLKMGANKYSGLFVI